MQLMTTWQRRSVTCVVIGGLWWGAGIAWAQGTVFFKNRVTGYVDAPVFDTDGLTKLAGTNYMAQLYAGPSADAQAPMGEPLSFRTGIGQGYLDDRGKDVCYSIANVVPGKEAYCQIRVWEAVHGKTYEAAVAKRGKTGASNLVRVVTGGYGSPPAPPNFLIGLQPFRLQQTR